MHLRRFAFFLVLVAATAQAQLKPDDPDWKEADVPPPPAVKLTGLIDIPMPGSQLRFGVDPASIAVGEDTMVRYVIVARSTSGTVTAMYEGLLCHRSEFKVFARYNPDSGWTPVREPKWQGLRDQGVSRHSLQVARGGACVGNSTNLSVSHIIRELKVGVDGRDRPEIR